MGCKLRGVLLCPKHQRSLRTGGRRVALHLSVSSTRMTQAQVRAPWCWMLLTRQPPSQEIRGCCVELADGGISLRSSYSIYRARQKKKKKQNPTFLRKEWLVGITAGVPLTARCLLYTFGQISFCNVKCTLLVIVQWVVPMLACHDGAGLRELQIKSFTERYG